ncbi:H3 K56 histone acetylation protein KAT11 [Diaporthe helianthi]|uniref:histone acetyltransferase n=1 Tax=Diaporthe helianthi TaxID=158607 RepID=A0A2P5I925_DIAHE|nr:H3 K56 histone acetylation protein KAT11 [Diaporthe helianthi]
MFSAASPSSATGSKQQCSAALLSRLAKVLPKGHRFTINHLSTPPTRTDALHSAPPDARPDRTYRESHFLAVSVDATSKLASSSTPSSPLTPGTGQDSSPPGRQVLVLGLEIYIFTTAWASTFFVSKADSTGYLSLLNLPKETPSPIREISSAFISYLVEQRRRENVQTIVSLFARAQNQYLFPGSVENKDKHVLDDRGLVRWWCRVLNAMMEAQSTHEDKIFRPSNKTGNWEDIKGYLIVPGLDAYDLRAFLPRTPNASSNWVLGHPLERISHFAREYDWVPPRCLVPKFPDDPKSRFRDELDLEASKSAQYEEKGLWRGLTTMDQFWEMMAFRQECSSGHMTGFIWVVLEPYGWAEQNTIAPSSPTNSLITPSASFDGSQATQPSTPPRRRGVAPGSTPKTSPLKTAMTPGSTQQTPTKPSPSKRKSDAKPKKLVLKGRIVPRLPRVKRHARNYVPDIPVSTSYYCWPPEGRGTRIAAEADYKRSVDLLTKLDFETLALATASTRRWINEVGGGQKWAMEVVGSRPLAATPNPTASTAINNMANLVRKKERASAGSEASSDRAQSLGSASAPSPAAQGGITMLLARKKPKKEATPPPPSSEDANPPSVNLLVPRKKRKESESGEAGPVGDDEDAAGGNPSSTINETPAVNALDGGLVRKKPKTA